MPAVMSAVCACLSSRFAGRGAARSGIPWHSSGAFWRGCSFAESAREKVAGPINATEANRFRDREVRPETKGRILGRKK